MTSAEHGPPGGEGSVPTSGLRPLAEGRARWPVLAAAVVLAALLVPGFLRLGTDNSPHVFFVEGSPSVERYQRFLDTFGSDKVVRVVLEGEELWSSAGLAALGRIEGAAGEVEGVAAVSGLHGHATAGGRGEWPPSDPELFRRRMERDPLARDLGWVGREGRLVTVAVVLEPRESRDREAALERLEEAVRGALKGNRGGDRVTGGTPPDLELSLAGSPVLDRALDRSTREIAERYFPLLVALAVALLAVTFRRWTAVAVPLVFVALSQLTVLGPMGWLGVDLNLVLAVLPPLLFVIALATAVHVLVRFRDFEAEGMTPAEALLATYRDKGWAVFWTGVSTLVGFSSLAVSQVGPVRSLGLWAGLGMVSMTALAFGFYPALLPAVRDGGGEAGNRPFESFFRRAGRHWAGWAASHRGLVLGVAGATALAALAGAPRLELETNALHYLAPDHPVRAGFEELETHGIGTSAVELVLTLPEGVGPEDGADLTSFESPEGFRRLERIASTLENEEPVLGTFSAASVLEDAVRGAPAGALFGASTVRRMAFDRVTGEGAPEPVQRSLDRLLAEGGRSARITLFTRTVGTGALDPLLERARRVAREEVPGVEVAVTGELPLMLESQRHLLATLGLSLTLTLVVIGGIFRLLLASSRLTLLALAPNLWPVVGVLGWMGWWGIPLDVATVMVASVVLGLAVDDTIHTLGHFRELAPQHGRFEAVAGTLERTAPAYVLTGVILAAGFGVCALSDFGPTARFGYLSAGAIGLAVLGDLFLLPALLGSTPHGVVERLGRSGSEG